MRRIDGVVFPLVQEGDEERGGGGGGGEGCSTVEGRNGLEEEDNGLVQDSNALVPYQDGEEARGATDGMGVVVGSVVGGHGVGSGPVVVAAGWLWKQV
jgi:hypothetical protein